LNEYVSNLNFLTFKVVDKRLFTGSFDGFLKIWDISDLSAEKAGGTDDKKQKSKEEQEKQDDEDFANDNATEEEKNQ
jgi:hypothetical protein